MSRLYDAKYFSSRLLGRSRFFSEAGAVIDVPMFVEAGDVIRINTDTGEYVEKEKKTK